MALAAFGVIAGVVSVNLWRELRDERQLTEQLRAELAESMRARPISLPQLPAAAPAQAPTPAPATPTLPAAAQVQPTSTIATGIPPPPIRGNALQQQLLADPEFAKARDAQQRLSVRRANPGLAEELELSAREEEQLFDLLARHTQDTAQELSGITRNGALDPAAVSTLERARQDRQQLLDDALLGMLGGNRFAQWQQYDKARPARSRVMSLNMQLAQSGMSLSEAQMRPLTTALHAEQERQARTTQPTGRDLRNVDTQTRLRMQDEMRQHNDESNRRMLEAAAPHLTPQQLNMLRTEMEVQQAMSRASSRVQRALQNAAQPAVAP